MAETGPEEAVTGSGLIHRIFRSSWIPEMVGKLSDVSVNFVIPVTSWEIVYWQTKIVELLTDKYFGKKSN